MLSQTFQCATSFPCQQTRFHRKTSTLFCLTFPNLCTAPTAHDHSSWALVHQKDYFTHIKLQGLKAKLFLGILSLQTRSTPLPCFTTFEHLFQKNSSDNLNSNDTWAKFDHLFPKKHVVKIRATDVNGTRMRKDSSTRSCLREIKQEKMKTFWWCTVLQWASFYY